MSSAQLTDSRVTQFQGVSITAPTGWTSRLLMLSHRGDRFAIQLANFGLPAQAGLEPPIEVADDRLAAIAGDDALISLIFNGRFTPSRRNDPVQVTGRHMNADHRAPRAQQFLSASFCVGGRCFDVEGLFGGDNPEANVDLTNSILSTLQVGNP